MPEYLSPGVYVEEVSSGIRPIEGVGTSTGAFVGRAVKGPVNEAVLITNPTQFFNTFGGFHQDYYLAYAVRHFFIEGGTRCYVVRVFNPNVVAPADAPADVARVVLNSSAPAPVLRVLAADEGAWGNNIFLQVGDPAFDPDDPDNDDQKFSLTVKYRESPDALPTTVETYSRLSMREFTPEGLPNPFHVENQINDVSRYIMVDDLSVVPADIAPPANSPAEDPDNPLDHLFQLQNGSDGQALAAADFIGDEVEASGLHAFDAVDDINIVAIPDLVHANVDPDEARDQILAAFTYCERRQDCFFVADSPGGLSPQRVLAYKQGRAPFSGNAFNSKYGAIYYPWIYVTDPLTGKRILFPPSGAVAGTYSATDVRRGVHKAPAGTEDPLNAAVDIERVITKGEHDTLNPEGVNAIRKFPDSGIVVWGARTVSADPEWRYVNVRRLFLFLEESIEEGTQWVVFEPNDPVLWKRIVRNVSAFLRVQWLEGKLVGDKPENAFFVKCDEETNPPESVDLGRVVTLIGVAPSKPAEFVIFRISQSRSGAQVTE
ncbi:MAG: phage tail sheath subtilisin-like domain-containing protein [Blastocatellia bacterium]|nr:phage tail sheath subtilisin-like domain-containing protein [Blastocatellia bacterium]